MEFLANIERPIVGTLHFCLGALSSCQSVVCVDGLHTLAYFLTDGLDWSKCELAHCLDFRNFLVIPPP